MSDVLPGSRAPLIEEHDRLLLDLDGVCYVGDRAVPAALDAMRTVRQTGLSVRFLTNNASRTPAEVAERLQGYGYQADVAEIVTSAVCAARLLADELPTGSPVLVVGGPGLEQALSECGLRPVRSAAADPVAVVQGWHPDVNWRAMAEATVAINAGARWIATNLDRTIPGERGRLPGNGALIGAVATAVEQQPRPVGKPEPAMYDAAGADAGSPLAVGDRLDTDIAGAIRARVPSLLVLTGVTRPLDLLRAGPEERPTHIGADLAAVTAAMPRVEQRGAAWLCREAEASVANGEVQVAGSAGPDGLDRLRAACAASWTSSDTIKWDAERVNALDLDC